MWRSTRTGTDGHAKTSGHSPEVKEKHPFREGEGEPPVPADSDGVTARKLTGVVIPLALVELNPLALAEHAHLPAS